MKSVPLKEHVEALLTEVNLRNQQRFDAQTKAIDAALISAEKAVTKAEIANEKRFESVNEFRGSLNDMVATLLPRAEADSRLAALSDKLDQALGRLDKSEGSGMGLKQGWGYLTTALAVILGVAAYLAK